MSRAEISTPRGPSHITTDDEVLAGCVASEKLYSAGEPQQAFNTLAPFLCSASVEPNVEGLQPRTAAELRLRAAVLLGALDQQPSAQRRARKSLRLASRLFLRLGDMDGVLRCERETALCYWREGRYRCARRIIVRALDSRADVRAETELAGLLVLAIVECCAGQYHAALSALQLAAPLADATDDANLQGSFCNTYGLVRKNLGLAGGDAELLQLAFIDYSAAGYYFGVAGNKVKAAAVESNRGELLSVFGQFDEAHRNIDRAQALARAAGDAVKAAWFDDARARPDGRR